MAQAARHWIFRVSLSALLAIAFAGAAWAQTPPADQSITLRPGQFVQRGQTPDSSASPVDFETDEPFSATYVGADVPSVVNEILGEFLKIDYSLAPDVTGQVTLRLEGVHSRLAAIAALRTALRPIGIAVIDRGDMVAVTRSNGQDTVAQAAAIDPGQRSPAGGGVVVLTPKHIAPSQLAPLVAPFASTATISSADDSRRFLIVRGDEAAINAVSSAAAMFDVDWFSQVSSGSFVLRHVSPRDMAAELRPLLGPAAGAVDLIPNPRLSTLVVLARDPEVLRQIEIRIRQLDQPSVTESAGLLIYRVQHVSAEQLAQSLRQTAGDGGGLSAAPIQSNPAPSRAPGDPGPPGAPASLAVAAISGTSTFSVSSNLTQNVVIVRGDANQLAEARAVLEALDRPPVQILISAAVVEVTLNDELQFGVNWSGIQDQFAATFTDTASGIVASQFPGLSLTYVNTDIEAALNLLASVTKVEVVSRPSVMALNNATANLQVGDQVPIVTQTAVSVTNPDAPIVNQTTYRDTGVILTVTPRVRAGGVIELEIQQEVSQVARTTSSGIDSPTIQQRKLESTLVVPSGRSVALGGLISTTRTNNIIGIPLLKDLPLLGHLFRSETTRVDRTELIVFLTPQVLADGEAAVEATDLLRRSFLKLEQELGPHP